MNKELKNLLKEINNKKQEVINLANANKIEEAKAAKKELIDLQAKFNTLYDLEDEHQNEQKENSIKDGINLSGAQDKAIKDFANAARNGFKVNNKMSSGSKEEGGYTVPEDIRTKIEKYRESKKSLMDLVTVVPVKTDNGSRTFKKRSQQIGFVKVGEGGKIGKKATPTFEIKSYEIEKYAGFFPVTNELLEDSDENIAGTLIEWIGDESRVTRNVLILEEIKKKSEVELQGLDDIKLALNVTLGSAFKATSKIITNDDGLHYLDTLKDSDGKYLLQPDPVKPMEMWLSAGASRIPVEVFPNSDMPTNSNKIPFVIGDLKEGIVLWDRKQLNIKMSDVAVIGDFNAYEEDLTLFRAIEREDVTTKDDEAFVNGYITKTP